MTQRRASLARSTSREDSAITRELLSLQSQFRGFLRHRLHSDSEVDDLLQNALVKALRRRSEVRENEKLVAWFYRILRRTLIDHQRSEIARTRRDDAWMRERTPDAVSKKTFCGCFSALLPHLDARAAELVRRVDLEGESLSRVAASLHLSPNAASVALHRARARLRRELVAFCGQCSEGACLDCDCAEKNV